jgi:hypothetical protein
MERMVEERLRAHLRQFARAPLIASGSQQGAAEAVLRALRRRDARLPELACLVLAYATTLAGVSLVLDAEVSSWLVTVGPEGARLTAAGWWCALVSSPLFWFLLLRWFWRHAVWGLLLRDLARLELRLVATHPDGAGGLAFIGQYPNAFAAFVFALSCVLGAVIARTLLQGDLTTAAYGQLMAAWLVVVIILFGLPPAGVLRAARAAQGGDAADRQLGGHPPRARGRARAARQQHERRGRCRSHRLRRHSRSLQALCGGQEALDVPDLARGDRSGCSRRASAAGRRRRHPAAGEGAAQNRSGIAAVMTVRTAQVCRPR